MTLTKTELLRLVESGELLEHVRAMPYENLSVNIENERPAYFYENPVESCRRACPGPVESISITITGRHTDPAWVPPMFYSDPRMTGSSQ